MAAMPYVYRLTNQATGEFYFGFRKANKVSGVDDLGKLYFTSSKYVKPRFNEFDYSILCEFDDADKAYWFEQSLIEENWSNPLMLNRKYQKHDSLTEMFKPKEHISDEHKRKVSLAMTGKLKSPEHNEKVSLAQKGRPLTAEHKRALCKPKRLTDKRIQANLNNKQQKPARCSCTICKTETSANQIGRHFNKCSKTT